MAIAAFLLQHCHQNSILLINYYKQQHSSSAASYTPHQLQVTSPSPRSQLCHANVGQTYPHKERHNRHAH